MSKREKAVSDEQIISALLSLGTVQDAAESLQITPPDDLRPEAKR